VQAASNPEIDAVPCGDKTMCFEIAALLLNVAVPAHLVQLLGFRASLFHGRTVLFWKRLPSLSYRVFDRQEGIRLR